MTLKNKNNNDCFGIELRGDDIILNYFPYNKINNENEENQSNNKKLINKNGENTSNKIKEKYKWLTWNLIRDLRREVYKKFYLESHLGMQQLCPEYAQSKKEYIVSIIPKLVKEIFGEHWEANINTNIIFN